MVLSRGGTAWESLLSRPSKSTVHSIIIHSSSPHSLGPTSPSISPPPPLAVPFFIDYCSLALSLGGQLSFITRARTRTHSAVSQQHQSIFDFHNRGEREEMESGRKTTEWTRDVREEQTDEIVCSQRAFFPFNLVFLPAFPLLLKKKNIGFTLFFFPFSLTLSYILKHYDALSCELKGLVKNVKISVKINQ